MSVPLRSKSNPIWTALALFGLTLLFYAPGLGRQEFVGTEDFRTRIASETFEDGEVWFPTYYGRTILTKPPLYYLTQAGSLGIQNRDGPAAARVTSLLALAITTALLAAAGTHAAGLRAGWTAGLAYLLGLNTLKNGVNAEIDPMFAMWIVAATLAAWKSWSASDRSLPWSMASAICLGLAALSKGPAAAIFLIAIAATWWWLGRGAGRKPAWSWWLTALAIGAIWPLSQLGLEDARADAAIRQDSDIATDWSPRMVIRSFLFPFTLFVASLPFSIPAVLRLRSAGRLPLDRFLLHVVGIAFVLMLIPAAKSTRYLLPCFPLLVLCGVLRLELLDWTAAWIRATCAAVLVAAAVAVPWLANDLPLAGILTLAALALTGFAGYRIAVRFPIVALLLLVPTARAGFTQVYVPIWEQSGESVAPILAELQSRIPPGGTLGVARIESPRLLEPLNCEISYWDRVYDLRQALARGVRPDRLLIFWTGYRKPLEGYREVARIPALGQELLLFEPE